MEAISLGSILLGTYLLILGLTPLAPDDNRAVLQALAQLLGLSSAVAYYLGFAPPPILRRAWQEPELRSFLAPRGQPPSTPDNAGYRARAGAWRDE